MTALAITGWDARTELGRGAAAPSHLRLTARGRAVLVVLALLVAAAFSLRGPAALAGSGQAGVPVDAVTIAPGQTLWQIAGSIAAPGEDVRDVVDLLMSLNEMSGPDLVAGQQLLVPERGSVG
jgi:hypothetical protein